MKTTLGAFLILCSYPFLTAFTILSGVNEATLPSTSDDPVVKFYWDGSVPKISKKEEFDGGRYVDLSDEEFMNVMLQEAFGVWNEVKGSFLEMEFERKEGVSIDSSDQTNVIKVKDTGNISAAAFAQPVLDDDFKFIEDCDITMGDTDTEAKDLSYILAHEIGHCLGLGHEHTSAKALMGYTRTDFNLYLSADDKAGIIYLYPDPEFVSGSPEYLYCGSLNGLGNSNLMLLFFLTLMPLLLAIVRTRFRRESSK